MITSLARGTCTSPTPAAAPWKEHRAPAHPLTRFKSCSAERNYYIFLSIEPHKEVLKLKAKCGRKADVQNKKQNKKHSCQVTNSRKHLNRRQTSGVTQSLRELGHGSRDAILYLYLYISNDHCLSPALPEYKLTLINKNGKNPAACVETRALARARAVSTQAVSTNSIEIKYLRLLFL